MSLCAGGSLIQDLIQHISQIGLKNENSFTSLETQIKANSIFLLMVHTLFIPIIAISKHWAICLS